MTRTRYSLALLLQSFGLVLKSKRLTDIAFEMQLLQDGEEFLGAYCWKEGEEIEEISMEYWTLRRIEREQGAIYDKISNAEAILTSAQEKRAALVDKSKESGDELYQAREQLFEEVEKLNFARDEIMAEAEVTKRKHAALKMKAKVLMEEGSANNEKVQDCRNSLAELKKTFESTKMRLSDLEREIEDKNEELSAAQEKIDLKVQGSRGVAQDGFALISQANRDITKFRSELGHLQEDYSKLCREIGRFLSIHEKRPDVRQACREQTTLLHQLRILRNSIQLNRKLVDHNTKD